LTDDFTIDRILRRAISTREGTNTRGRQGIVTITRRRTTLATAHHRTSHWARTGTRTHSSALRTVPARRRRTSHTLRTASARTVTTSGTRTIRATGSEPASRRGTVAAARWIAAASTTAVARRRRSHAVGVLRFKSTVRSLMHQHGRVGGVLHVVRVRGLNGHRGKLILHRACAGSCTITSKRWCSGIKWGAVVTSSFVALGLEGSELRTLGVVERAVHGRRAVRSRQFVGHQTLVLQVVVIVGTIHLGVLGDTLLACLS